MLPHVIRFNGAQFGAWYHDLLEGTGGANGFPRPDERGRKAWPISWPGWPHKAGLPARLSECGVEQATLRRIGRRRGQAMDRPVQSRVRSTRPICRRSTRRPFDGRTCFCRWPASAWRCAFAAWWSPGQSGPAATRSRSPRLGTLGRTWPLFRGNALATGVVQGSLPEKLEVLWKFQAKEGGFEATAVIDRRDGSMSARSTEISTPSIEDGQGRVEVSHRARLLGRRPAIADGRVFAGDTDGKFYCLRRGQRHSCCGIRGHGRNQLGPQFLQGHGAVRLAGRHALCPGCRPAASWSGNTRSATRSAARPPWSTAGRLVAGCDGKLHIIGSTTAKKSAPSRSIRRLAAPPPSRAI